MVGDENILVEFDYQNIVLVDPNKIVDSDGRAKERFLKQENLVYYANLECNLFPRTRLAVDSSGAINNKTVSIAKIDYLNPSGNFLLENAYLDDLTGLGGLNKSAANQIIEKSAKTSDNQTYVYQETINKVNTDLLLISRIKVELGLSLMPTVSIELQDIRGRALFEQGENSPYAIFFNYPYPLFYLTVKGYLGQAIKYQLALRTFNASFDSSTGNFIISLNFYAFKYNVLTNLMMDYVDSVPYMYKNKYFKTNNDSTTKETVTFRGYEKIKEVYSEYKSKGLIDSNFPEITVKELVKRLSLLETYILNTFKDIDLTSLTDAENYVKTLISYEKEVIGYSDSWVKTYLDENNFLVLLKNNTRVYKLKQEIIANDRKSEADSNIRNIVDTNNGYLAGNNVFGTGKKLEINNDISINDFILKNIKETDINWKETYTSLTGKNDYETDVYYKFINNLKLDINNGYYRYVFNGTGSFLDKMSVLQTKASSNLTKLQDEYSKILVDRLNNNNQNGLGFKPTLKNVIAVILASSEAFLRLMSDVHEKAWGLSRDRTRIEATLGPDKSAVGVDNRDNVSIDGANLIPVYPWPQYFVEKITDSGERFILTYPGNHNVITKTKGYSFDIWPEIEFVEEFLKAKRIIKDNTFNFNFGNTISNTEEGTDKISFNAIDYTNNFSFFRNKQEVKFIYEIWERIFLMSFYQRFDGNAAKNQLLEILSDSEANNIANSLINGSPFLIKKLKELNLNSANYIATLQSISNSGIGESWQKFVRDIFVTDYIQEETTNSFNIYTLDYFNSGIDKISSGVDTTKLESYIKSTVTNEVRFLDTFPFSISGWSQNNMSAGFLNNNIRYLYNTSDIYLVDNTTKLICNFNSSSTDNPRPVTSFTYEVATNPQYNLSLITDKTSLANFYTERFYEKYKQQVTEGAVKYYNYSGDVIYTQTTSLLNTPYFVNAILNDVDKWYLNNDNTPYITSAYLFLNSLPIATLREKYKYFNNLPYGNDSDYIFSAFKKFGAIHKVPYALILKYGSIWYRYKHKITTGTDILDNAWGDFDYIKNFDPETEDLAKTYKLNIGGNIIDFALETQAISSNVQYDKINLGFYPKVVDNFNLFYFGNKMFSGYTDDAINSKLYTNDGFRLTLIDDAKINSISLDNKNIINVNPWNVTIIDNKNGFEYVVPSFGSNFNQVKFECFNSDGTNKIPVNNNKSVYNGSVRSFWALPNYGYFENGSLTKPDYRSYLKVIDSQSSTQSAFNLDDEYYYTTIEEMLSVFNKDILDRFETEFLNFSKSRYDLEVINVDDATFNFNGVNVEGTKVFRKKLNNLEVNSDTIYHNFQILMTQLMGVNNQYINSANSKVLTETISTEQFNKIKATLDGFLNYDVIIKYGNPGDYNRRLFDSYSNNFSVIDPITFDYYKSGVLPTASSLPTIPLDDYKAKNPEAWKALELYVGFSNIEGIKYTSTGSTITDFFVDMNVEFTQDSVSQLSPLIKIYATKKAADPTYNASKFRNDITSYISEETSFNNLVLDTVLTKLRKNLPSVSTSPEQEIGTDGEQIKLELWELFKGINDTWIAGYDYSQTTFLQDVLLLDRGNRNIADSTLIDPFKVKNLFTNINPKASVYVYLETLIREHNFSVMMHPGYVNYYNVQEVSKNNVPKIDSTLEFGNTLFGTFMSVDTRESSPKLVCIYNAKASEHPDIKNDFYRFKTDTLSLVRSSDNPLIDPLTNKQDWGLSNRIVGFNVDIGIRNQSIFSNFNVSQNIGKSTSESIIQENNMIEQANGKAVATQNVSLWNFYKSRSYECSVSCLGNAMIQPTMYFNLKYVPMFNGPYYITSVEHTITPGKFDTSFKGIRQQVFAYPNESETYLQTITKELFSQLIQINSSSTTNLTTQSTNTSSEVVDPAPCALLIAINYADYVPNQIRSQTNTNVTKLGKAISAQTSNDMTRVLSFVSCYVNSYDINTQTFITFNNNFAKVPLNIDWGENLSSFFNKEYLCIKTNNDYVPTALFDDKESCIKFLVNVWNPNIANNTKKTSQAIASALISKNLNNGLTQENLEPKCEEALNLIINSKIFG